MNQIARFTRAISRAPQAVEYLKGRGLTGEVGQTLQHWVCPGDWDQVRRRFDPAGITSNCLSPGGMLIPRQRPWQL